MFPVNKRGLLAYVMDREGFVEVFDDEDDDEDDDGGELLLDNDFSLSSLTICTGTGEKREFLNFLIVLARSPTVDVNLSCI